MATAPTVPNAFGSIVSAKAGEIRNIANEPDVKGWLEDLGLEKLGPTETRNDQEKQCFRWLETVGRKALIKAEGFDDDAEAMLLSWLKPKGSTPSLKPF